VGTTKSKRSYSGNIGDRFSYTAVAAWAIILLGLVLRSAQYTVNRPLWLDEAYLALNIINRSLPALTQPLDNTQAAPVGFLILEKLVVLGLGSSEYALRLIPFVAGCASLWLMYHLARRCVQIPETLLALSLFALGSHQIYYTSEVKQYASDVTVALLLLLLAAKHFDAEQETPQFVLLGLVGALGIWLSHPALFVAAGAGFALALHYGSRRDWARLRAVLAVALWWGVNLLALYFISLRHIADRQALLQYWGPSFAPWPPWKAPFWFIESALHAFADPVGLVPHGAATAASLLTLLSVIGSIWLLARKWRWGILLLTPLALTLGASALHLYPFRTRMLLFAVPIILILVTEGLEPLRLALNRWRWVSLGVWATLAACLLYLPMSAAIENLTAPDLKEEIRPVMAYLEENRQADDVIYVYYGAIPAFQYYAPSYGIDSKDYVIGTAGRDDPQKYVQDLDKFGGSSRLWIVFSHVYDWDEIDERRFILDYLDTVGRKIDGTEHMGAFGYLYDLSLQP
jgi:hypothetical protein